MPPKAPAKYVHIVLCVLCFALCVVFFVFHCFSWRPLLLLVSVFSLHLLEKTHIWWNTLYLQEEPFALIHTL